MKEIWTTVHGGWGDAIANYGNIRVALEENEADKANVIFFGIDKQLIPFIKAQNGINEVLHLNINEKSEYWQYTVMAACDFPLYMRMTGLQDKYPDLIPTHITKYYQVENQTLCHRYFEANLPPSKFDWTGILPSEPFLVVQPFSCHSCHFDFHWPHWIEALNFVLDNSPMKVVLIGQLKSMYDDSYVFPWVEHSNLINLVGQTPSMIDVFHIMKQSAGVITTSNALSMWSIVSKKPALVVCNQGIHKVAPYYYNWIHHEPNIVMDCTTTMSEFRNISSNFIKGL